MTCAHPPMPSCPTARRRKPLSPLSIGCLYVSLSGAGPTSYGIFPDAAGAAAAAEQLRAQHPGWWIVATTLGD